MRAQELLTEACDRWIDLSLHGALTSLDIIACYCTYHCLFILVSPLSWGSCHWCLLICHWSLIPWVMIYTDIIEVYTCLYLSFFFYPRGLGWIMGLWILSPSIPPPIITILSYPGVQSEAPFSYPRSVAFAPYSWRIGRISLCSVRGKARAGWRAIIHIIRCKCFSFQWP